MSQRLSGKASPHARQALEVLSVWPRTIIADLRRHGSNVDRVLDEAGLDLRRVNREGGRIPWQSQATLMDIAAREFGDECYGIHLAAKVDVRDADALAYVGLTSHTLGEALANLARYVQTFNEVVRFDLSTEDGFTVLGISGVDPALVHHPQQMEFGAALRCKRPHGWLVLRRGRAKPPCCDERHDARPGAPHGRQFRQAA
jgi:hypothetical protein